MRDGHGGVVMGSEISGGCRNIFAENLKMDSPNLDRVLRIKTNSLRGGTIENIYLRNIEVGEVRESIVRVNFYYEEGDVGTHTPIVRNVYLQNIKSEKSKYAFFLKGYERTPISNFVIEACTFNGVTHGNVISDYKDFTFNNVVINGEKVSSVEELIQN
jgi:polygalacturonase